MPIDIKVGFDLHLLIPVGLAHHWVIFDVESHHQNDETQKLNQEKKALSRLR